MDLETAQTTTIVKLLILKQGEYDMWRLRIEQYFQVQDYALWDVIENGNSFKPVAQTITNVDVMSSASSAVTYTSVYTDSEPGRVFWGADEEISDGGVPRPEYPEYLVPSEDEAPMEDQPLPADASPVALSPGYVPDSDPEEDPEEDSEEEHADYPADGGDGDDEPSDDDTDDDDEADDYR
ncbi:hypothetical protein Tco_1212239 [Tanacetum coccineum]